KDTMNIAGANSFTKSEILQAVYMLEEHAYIKRIEYGSEVRYTKTGEGNRLLARLKKRNT
ncbi:hypothetical protein ELF22_15700, partial [Listeria monocytogenes]|nr:hypothetical protein [Listeria monocytogenes]